MTGRRILALTLCMLLLAQLPLTALAAEADTDPAATETAEVEEDAADGEDAVVSEESAEATSNETAASGSWADEALAYCVAQGLMDADDLRGSEAATRAELADMVTRLFGTLTYSPLSASTYTGPYTEALAKAVALGVLTGDGDGDLDPDGLVTREEACIMLCRVFGLYGGTYEDLSAFSDGDTVGYWAVSSVGYLVKNGYLSGSNGLLRPKGTITRRELAQLLKNLGGMKASSDALPASGTVILQDSTSKLENITLDGDLILQVQNDTLELTNVTITGRLVVSGSEKLALTVGDGCQIGTLVLANASGTALTIGDGAQVDDVASLLGFATILGSGGTLYAAVTTGIYAGSWDRIDAAGTKPVTIASSVTATEVEVSGHGTQVQMDTDCETLTVSGESVTVTGSGSAAELVRESGGSTVSVPVGQTTDTYDAGIQNIVISSDYTVDGHGDGAASVTATFTFSNVDLTGTNGAPSRICTIDWSQDYVSLGETETFQLYEGATVSRTVEVDLEDLGNTMVLAIIVKASGQARAGYAYVPIAEYTALNTVTTIEVEATVKYDTTLYSSYGLTNAIGTVSKGTVGIYYNYYGTTAGCIRLPDGSTGWVRWDALDISDEDYTRYTDYSTYTKEGFVNAMGYSSTTEMLVWVSLKTQKVNVFYGSQGNWTLAQSFSCCTGKNSTPTIAGVFSYKYKDAIWDFGSYYVKPALVFNGSHAFHSRTYVKSTGQLLDATIGTPASHGCVRMYDSDVQWLDQNMKVGTTVVVY